MPEANPSFNLPNNQPAPGPNPETTPSLNSQPTPGTPAATPDSTPTPMPSPILKSKVQKPKNQLLPVVIILAILTLAGLGTSIYFGIQSSSQASEISDLKTELDNLTKKDGISQPETTNPETKPENQPQGSNNQTSNTPAQATLYLEPEGWNVKFAYPEGVTNVIASTNDNFDGALYIDSITYNGKTYDVNLFGGAEAYRHYPFFLGIVMRWDKNAAHESWNNTPSVYDGNTLILEQGPLEYYYGGGNGYETGDETDYNKAVELTSQLLHSITPKS